MNLGKLFERAFSSRSKNSRRAGAVARAAAPVLFESLENRRLLSTYTNTTLPSGHSLFYLEAGNVTGKVVIHEDSSTGPVAYTYNNTTGMDIVDLGSLSGVTVVDQVVAAKKPTADGDNDSGIKVQGGSGGKLEIDAGAGDQLVRVTDSSSSSTTISTTDPGASVTSTDKAGSGVPNIVIVTNGTVASTFFNQSTGMGTGTQVDVAIDDSTARPPGLDAAITSYVSLIDVS